MEQYKKTRLYDADGNLNIRWYAYYSYIDPESNKYKRFFHKISLKLKTKDK